MTRVLDDLVTAETPLRGNFSGVFGVPRHQWSSLSPLSSWTRISPPVTAGTNGALTTKNTKKDEGHEGRIVPSDLH